MRLFPSLVFAVAVTLSAQADDVLALLETHCVQCHGGGKTKAGLDLTTRENLLRGGETGDAIVLGKPEASLLYRMITHEEEPGMPHKEEKLPDATIAQFAEWIRAGVPYARPLNSKPVTPAPAHAAAGTSAAKAFVISDADRAHWAFQPVKRPAIPGGAASLKRPEFQPGTSMKKAGSESQPHLSNPIDSFIRARLTKEGLTPSAPASRETLIRRVTFDLVGLPPTPAEIDAFVNDPSPQAYEALVDRLLASPHYGERWGRHWLDLARFAESDGFEHDAVRPHAWRYRDYVVRSFNADKPYDRFIREQVAGDELYPGDPDALIATAFNLLGPDMVDSADQVQRRRNTLNDMTDTTSLAFLGLTVGCARCHDHKFEPISQRDYYSLQAFFAPAKFRNDVPVPTKKEREEYEAAMARYNEQTKTLQDEIAAIEEPYRKTIFARKLAKLSPEAQAAHVVPKEQRTTEQENLVLETAQYVTIPPKELTAAMKKSDRDRHATLLDELKPFPKPKPLPASLALENGPPVKTHVLHRGDYNQPTEEVTPRIPEVLGGGAGSPSRSSQAEETRQDQTLTKAPRAAENRPESQRAPAAEVTNNAGRLGQPAPPPASGSRTALANWIASPGNPLTARVMVNRIWQHHFGRGLVPTPSDYGTHGQKPTHPELLDWLASEFVAHGWSVKHLHRLMLLSATYRQTSTAEAAVAKRDPENKLYARMNRLRMEGEVIRDSLLAISGQLNPKLGGPGVFPPIPKELFEGAKGWTTTANESEHGRRSLYIFARRNLRFPFLEVFDSPDSNMSCASRDRSTTAPQSLTLLNAEEVLNAAERTAERITKEAKPDSLEARVILAYRLILGRAPTRNELSLSQQFLKHSPVSELCRALFNLNAFVYAD